jgi:hypothetical protein
MSGPRPVLARMARQQPRRPQLVRIAVFLGLVARQRHQPGLGLRRDHRLLARARSVVEWRQRAIGDRPLDAALDRLMMHAKSSSHGKERRVLAIGQQHRGPRHPARRLGSGPRKSRQRFNFLLGHRQLNCLPPCCHDTNPRSANLKRGIHQHASSSLRAGFMESVVYSRFCD